MKRKTAEELYDCWVTGDAFSAGRAIFEPLTPAQQVDRAADVLAACVARLPAPEAVMKVLELARDPSHWHEAHDAFSAVRNLTLEEERTPSDSAYGAMLFVAENAAKAIYSASGRSAPFDHDAPWWIAPCARAFVQAVGEIACER